MWADRSGRASQGVWRLPILADRLVAGGIKSPSYPKVCIIAESARVVDGDDGFGYCAAKMATDVAIEVARSKAVGLVAVHRSGHLGPAGWYAARAAEEGMICLVVSNAYPRVHAPGGDAAIIGTNPLAFAISGGDAGPTLIDMSTAESAGSKVRWASESVVPSTEGPSEKTDSVGDALGSMGGAKGFGLGVLVELLAGGLSGAAMGPEIRSLYEHPGEPGGNGHLILVIDPSRFAGEGILESRSSSFLEEVRRSGPSVRIPGDGTRAALKRSAEEGVELLGPSRSAVQTVAERFSVPSPLD